MELKETVGNLIKLKEVQDLNEIRVGELKTIIDADQKIKSEMLNEMEVNKVHLGNLQNEKRELFKMIDEIKSKQADEMNVYKDRIIELDVEISGYNERIAQMEVELNYEKDYHRKCEETIKDITDHRDKACKDIEGLKQ